MFKGGVKLTTSEWTRFLLHDAARYEPGQESEHPAGDASPPPITGSGTVRLHRRDLPGVPGLASFPFAGEKLFS